ncbi:raffinose/stachyose/melibiose transport system substrate-binding protein [Deinobacterium chartae]|uniref:Raffinose/stachyose/melibiose transport system substrate-binding protein n=1 Tax=Deinobacterium chartae TaxID=521158 RepID=A0A841I1T9_9DEIO|nr:extracellular solute-binding protein [Deinobacterium chartae]MBB6098359.1 raffinose/stachyose/melibiose transport system substrate-binding protein [Deinobacterium chartae]
MLKVSKLALTALLFLPALSACNQSDKNVEISLFHRWPNEPKKSYFDKIIEQFEQENPGITVKVDKVLNDAYKDKVRVLVGSSNPPDVFFSWSGEFANNLVRSGRVMDLTDMLNEDGTWSGQIVQNQIEPFKLDGKVYGIPWAMHSKSMFYNKDLFEQHGLAVPTTFDELLEVCRALQEKGITPIAFGSQAPWPISHYLGTLNQRIVDPEVIARDYNRATGEFTDPGYVEALARFKELSAYMNPDPNALDHETIRNNFIAGKTAMAYLQSAEIKYLVEGAQFEFDAFNFPAIEGGKGDPSQLTGAPEGFMISKTTKHPQEAMRLLKFLISKSTGEQLTRDTGEMSTIRGAVNADTAPPAIVEAAQQVEQAQGMTMWLDNALDSTIVDAYLRGTQLLIGGEKTPEQVMRDVQQAAQKVRTEAAQ